MYSNTSFDISIFIINSFNKFIIESLSGCFESFFKYNLNKNIYMDTFWISSIIEKYSDIYLLVFIISVNSLII